MLRQVVEKEFPLRDSPKFRHLMIVEANHERGNDIEFLTEVWERTKRLDSLNDAADTEKARDFPEHWQAIHVEANAGMTEESAQCRESILRRSPDRECAWDAPRRVQAGESAGC